MTCIQNYRSTPKTHYTTRIPSTHTNKEVFPDLCNGQFASEDSPCGSFCSRFLPSLFSLYQVSIALIALSVLANWTGLYIQAFPSQRYLIVAVLATTRPLHVFVPAKISFAPQFWILQRRGKSWIIISLLGLSESPDNWAEDVKEESGPEYFDWEDYLHYPIPLQK